MKTARMIKTLLVASALAMPLAASALEWTGVAGLLYSRSDEWYESGLHAHRQRLDLNLKLDARGYFSDPGIFRWGGGVAYFRVSDKVNETPTTLGDALTYRFQADLFAHRSSPFTAMAYATRTDTRFGTSLTGPDVGERTYEGLGGTIAIAPRALPYLSLGYDNQKVTDRIPGLPQHDSEKQLLAATLTHSNEAFGLNVQFRGEQSDGTWVMDQQDTYSVTALGQSTIGTNARIYLSEVYYERLPTTAAAGFYGVTTQGFQAGYLSGFERGGQNQVRYAYSHGHTSTATLNLDSAAQSLRVESDLLLSEGETRSWIHFLADGTMTSQRSAVASLETQGATVGAQYRRLRKSDRVNWEVGGGPIISYLDAPNAPSHPGYGAAADGRLSRDWGSNRISLYYSVDYGSDVYGRTGWTLGQTLTAALSGPAADLGQFNTSLVASARRGWNPVLGDGSTRSIQLDGRLTMKRQSLDATLGVASGIVGTAPHQFIGDGLFLPSGFNSHTLFARAGASATLMENLVSRVEARLSDSVIPGQPDYTVLEGRVSLTYRYAAFDLSLEDRFSRSDSGATLSTGNLVMVSVSRTIGSRY